MGSRVAAAIFQAASARHTGTASFNLAKLNPAVQFSLLVMMYISIYPIAISIRIGGDYEEQPLGLSHAEQSPDERADGKSYLISHMRNQLSFDLWYIFLGVFCMCCSESKKITDRQDYVRIYIYPDNYVTLDTITNTQKIRRHSRYSPSFSKSCPHTAMSAFRSDIRQTQPRCPATLVCLAKSLCVL
jgi:hypothetical protein